MVAERSRKVLMHVQLSQDVYTAIRTLLGNFPVLLDNVKILTIILRRKSRKTAKLPSKMKIAVQMSSSNCFVPNKDSQKFSTLQSVNANLQLDIFSVKEEL